MIQENKDFHSLYETWNRLANKITYLEITPENLRELAKMSEEMARMIEGE